MTDYAEERPGWGREVKNELYAGDTGDKADAGKPPLDLIPWESVIGIARVFDFGAKKYAPRNWHGLSKSRLFAAAIRHLVAWWMGEDDDEETGESHLYHAGCCVLMLASHHGLDDRPGRKREVEVDVSTFDQEGTETIRWTEQLVQDEHGEHWVPFQGEFGPLDPSAQVADAVMEEE